jgi:hypothetical protein
MAVAVLCEIVICVDVGAAGVSEDFDVVTASGADGAEAGDEAPAESA